MFGTLFLYMSESLSEYESAFSWLLEFEMGGPLSEPFVVSTPSLGLRDVFAGLEVP